jgi:dGTPase
MAYTEHDRARRAPEPPKQARTGRSDFERDRARVLHSAALRRLAAKTQVVQVGVDDFPRTRLTHSLECAQIGRELAAALGADPDVVDAGCLAHDLGHPPFGHNGEQALDDVARPCGGFEGNAQSFRILTRLEAKVLDETGRSQGLNLTRAALDTATKYPWPKGPGRTKYGVYADDVAAFEWLRENAPAGRRCLEAQIMDWADDIAYSVHDLEDGVHSGHVRLSVLNDPSERAELAKLAATVYSDESADTLLGALERLMTVDWWPADFDGSQAALVRLKRMTSELIGRLVAAALDATRASAGDRELARYATDLVVPSTARGECAVLKAVTHRYVMDRAGVAATQAAERELVAELAEALVRRAPDGLERTLRDAWQTAATDNERLRIVVDQVAALTDTSARSWHRRLC